MAFQSNRWGAAAVADPEPEARQIEHVLVRLDAVGALGAGGAGAGPHPGPRLSLILQTVATLLRALEYRDPGTGAHARRVTRLALHLADELDLGPADRAVLEVGALLHDVGKIAVSDAVLHKPGSLTAAERAEIEAHPVQGVRLLEALSPLAAILPIVRSHHERWDGRGYPDGLAGENIPYLARVVALADAFDAMTADRPYRHALPPAIALRRIADGAGGQFDPELAAAFVRCRPARACA